MKDFTRRSQTISAISFTDAVGILSGDSFPWEAWFNVPINSVYLKADGTDWKKVGQGDGPSDWKKKIRFSEDVGVNEKVQPNHGFSVGNLPLPVYIDQNGDFQLARSDNELYTSILYLTGVVDSDTVEYLPGGNIVTFPGHNLSVGEYYFLSPTDPGGVVVTVDRSGIQDPCFYVIDDSSILLLDNLPVDRDSFYNPVIRLTNSSTQQNLNESTSFQLFSELNLVTENENNFYTVTPAGISPRRKGKFKVMVSLHTQASSSRVNAEVSFAVNGQPQGPIAASGYIRNASGHTRSSYFLEDRLSLNPGDEVSIVTRREASNGVLTLAEPGTSIMIIERVRSNV